MMLFGANRYSAVLLLGLSTGALLAADPRYIPPTKSSPPSPMKLESDRKLAETKRKMEQAKRSMQADQQRITDKALKNIAAARDNTKSGSSSAPKFDPIGAPPPDEVFLAFVSAAKNAGSMEQLLPYLPQREQESLKAQQSRFDPKQAARNRDSLHKQNPKLTPENLAHLSESPYASALKWHKGMANSIIKIMEVKVDGERATIQVSTNKGATINGDYYGYGMADVKMVGEGRTWKLDKFDSSILVYKEAP